jgi:hypothetical protein
MNTSKAQEGAPKLDDVKKECRLLETALKNGTAAIKWGVELGTMLLVKNLTHLMPILWR